MKNIRERSVRNSRSELAGPLHQRAESIQRSQEIQKEVKRIRVREMEIIDPSNHNPKEVIQKLIEKHPTNSKKDISIKNVRQRLMDSFRERTKTQRLSNQPKSQFSQQQTDAQKYKPSFRKKTLRLQPTHKPTTELKIKINKLQYSETNKKSRTRTNLFLLKPNTPKHTKIRIKNNFFHPEPWLTNTFVEEDYLTIQ